MTSLRPARYAHPRGPHSLTPPHPAPPHPRSLPAPPRPESDPACLPLAGFTVLDLGHHLAGPAVGLMLADLGATVIAIHAPGRQGRDDPTQAILGRTKTHITLDLKTAAGLAQLEAMIARADVLIENFRPGVMDRLGLPVARTRALTPPWCA